MIDKRGFSGVESNRGRPSAVLFDAVGTLIYPNPAVAVAYRAAGLRFGVDLTEAEIERRFRHAFARRETEDRECFALLTSEAHELRRWRHIVGEVFPEASNGEGLFAALWQHFAEPSNWRPFEDAVACLNALSEAGITVGIASNLDSRLPHILAQLPPLDQCRHVFYSALLGHRKPSIEFFRAIEAALGLRPHQLLLVGDDLENDYRGAHAAGWNAIQMQRSRAPRMVETVPS